MVTEGLKAIRVLMALQYVAFYSPIACVYVPFQGPRGTRGKRGPKGFIGHTVHE